MCGVGGKVGWAPPSYLKKCTAEKPDTEGESDESDDEFMTNPDTCEILVDSSLLWYLRVAIENYLNIFEYWN